MRYAASEKLEIIRIVEQSHLPVRRTLEKLGILPGSFYRWYDKYRSGGVEALEDKSSAPSRVWNRIPDDVRAGIIDLALDCPEMSPRELAAKFTDTRKYYVSEASVYRLLKSHDLITSPAFIVIKAADEFRDKTTAPNQRRVEDALPAPSDRLHVPEGHWLGMVLSEHDPRRLLTLHHCLETLCDHARGCHRYVAAGDGRVRLR